MSVNTLLTSAADYENQSLFYKAYEAIRIVVTDLLPSNITFVIPNAIFWAYRMMWTGSIKWEAVTADTTAKTGYLFSHTQLNSTTSAILLLHGEHSHPLTAIHLADIAKEEGVAVFSVHLPYDDAHPEIHRSMLKKSIDRIYVLFEQNGHPLSNLKLAGHSRGAIEAAHEAFVENNPKVDGVFAIAGRFRVIRPSLRPCRASLEPCINTLSEKLYSATSRLPFYQVAATEDWCIDPEASVPRRDLSHLFVNASHLSVLNHPDTLRQFRVWTRI